MRLRFLDFILCEECQKPFGVVVFKEKKNGYIKNDTPVHSCKWYCAKLKRKNPEKIPGKTCLGCHKNEIVDGYLICDSCGKHYPVINEIPILLANAASLYPEFYLKYQDRLPQLSISREELEEYNQKRMATQKAYTYEWTTYKRLLGERDLIPWKVTKTNLDELKPKLALDAACGYGRHTNAVKNKIGEVVSFDFSGSVWSAKEYNGEDHNVYLSQSDINDMLFRKGVFDLVYAFGCLQHTPVPKTTFNNLVDRMAPGATIITGNYILKHKTAYFFEKIIRSVTTKMDHRLLHYLCYYAYPLNFAFWKLGLRHVPGISHAIRFLVRVDPDPKACVIDTFDFWMVPYQRRYPPQEILDWFYDRDLKIVRNELKYSNVRAEKPIK